MSFLSWLKSLLWQLKGGWRLHDLSMSDGEFLIAVLKECPEGAILSLDECECERWVGELREWSYRSKHEQYEADYYLIEERFVEMINRLKQWCEDVNAN